MTFPFLKRFQFSLDCGGTSNAATILKFLIKKIKRKIFEKLLNIIGSDLRLFFHKRGYQADLKRL